MYKVGIVFERLVVVKMKVVLFVSMSILWFELIVVVFGLKMIEFIFRVLNINLS